MRSLKTLFSFDNMTFFSLSILSKSRVSSNLIFVALRLGILRPYSRLNFQKTNDKLNVRADSDLNYDWLLLHHTPPPFSHIVIVVYVATSLSTARGYLPVKAVGLA
jgi:hypothetical protein